MNYTKVNFLLRRNSIEKRIFKLIADKKGDLFISFPYCKPNLFYAGLATMLANKSKMELNPVVEGKDCEISVKLSYHSDGQIHIKPENNAQLNQPLSYKLTEVKGTPFIYLKGDHILTVDVEGFEHFKDFVPKKKDEIYFGFETPVDAKRFKFVFYAGLSDEQISGKFKHCKILSVTRPSEPSPLKIGVFFTPFKESLDKDKDGNNLSLYSLIGLQSNEVNIKNDLHFLYVYAKNNEAI